MEKINIKYPDIISVSNLLLAWQEFVRGKKGKRDVQEFQLNLMDNIFSLHNDLKTGSYKHSSYHAFNISDPKPRNIHKASVRDRLLHHCLYRQLYPYFDKKFIHDSYSCRLNKGTHKALERFRQFSYRVSKNNTKTCWVLKCDIKKFFASVDQETLINFLRKYVLDNDTLLLLTAVIKSFSSGDKGKGLPLGNLTSQLLVNIYMNEFDQYIKHVIKHKNYIRYADDFVFLDTNRDMLLELTPKIASFLEEELKLQLHPNKIYLKTLSSGVDFLGWVNFFTHRVLRTTTKRRMVKKIRETGGQAETVQSYLGLLKHGSGYKLEREILDIVELSECHHSR